MEINKKEMKTNPQGLGQDPETEEEPQGTQQVVVKGTIQGMQGLGIYHHSRSPLDTYRTTEDTIANRRGTMGFLPSHKNDLSWQKALW